MQRKTLIGIGAAAAILCVLFFVLPAIPPLARNFDPQQWQTCAHHSDRYAMHDDLLRKHKLVGLSRQELIQLLGPPDGSKDAPELEWDMGVVGTYDDNAFRVQLKDDKVVSYSIFQR